MTKSKQNKPPDPDLEHGIKYWESQSPSYNGVLGGYGIGSLPRIDALGSRQFLMYLLPELCTVPSALRPLPSPGLGEGKLPTRRTRALDIGAGVGRVTADVLLHLFSDIILVEPVESFVSEALRRARASAAPPARDSEAIPLRDASGHEDTNDLEVAPWKGLHDKTKSVTFVQATLQAFDPSHPRVSGEAGPIVKTRVLGRVGYDPAEDGAPDDLDDKFDVVFCQWCLGALNDGDLVQFFRRCKTALRDPARGLIMVKENLCSDATQGKARTVFDDSDSSLTRSDLAWKKTFETAGLSLVHEQTQQGFSPELYRVKMYALR